MFVALIFGWWWCVVLTILLRLTENVFWSNVNKQGLIEEAEQTEDDEYKELMELPNEIMNKLTSVKNNFVETMKSKVY